MLFHFKDTLHHFKFVNWWIRSFVFLMSRTGYTLISCPRPVLSSTAHQFGHVEFWNYRIFVVIFSLQAVAVEKIKTNVQNSTRPNRWAAEDVSQFKSQYSISTNHKTADWSKLAERIVEGRNLRCCSVRPDGALESWNKLKMALVRAINVKEKD